MSEEDKVSGEEAVQDAQAAESEVLDNADQAAEEAVEPTIDSLQIEIDQLQGKLLHANKIAQEATLRAQAEVQNLRKRLERDTDNARKFALEKFAKELLTVADSMDRGLQNLPENAPEEMKEGMKLTFKQFLSVLEKFEVKCVDPMGEKFDADLHEVVSMLPSDEEKGTVVNVMQKGYTLNGRLLRAAMVAVAQ